MHSTSFDPIDPVEPSIVARVREWTDQAVTPVDAAAVARAASSAATARVWHRGRWREALRVQRQPHHVDRRYSLLGRGEGLHVPSS